MWWALEHRAASASLKKWYSIALTLSFVLVSMLPCLAFFKVAYTLERELLVERAQLNLAADLQARSERVRDRYSGILTSEPKTAFLQRRLTEETLDVYQNIPADTCDTWIPCVEFGSFPRPDGETEENPDPLRTLFREVRPLYDDFAGETWTLLHASSGHPVGDDDELRLTYTYLENEGVEIRSDLPHMGMTTEPLAWIGWVVVVLVVGGGVRVIASKVFLIDIPNPVLRSARLDSPELVCRNRVILGHPFSRKSEALRLRDDVHVLDLPELRRSTESLTSIKLPDDKVIVLDQFEHQIDDWKWTHRKLELVEELVYARRKKKDVRNSNVLIVSSVDQVFYEATGGSGKKQNGAEVEDGAEMESDLDRWTAVLSSFEVLDYQAPTDSSIDNFSGDLRRRLSAAGADSEPPPVPQPMRETLVEVLKSECCATPALRSVATEIADSVPRAPEASRPKPQQLADIIYDRCEAYYRSLWKTCSKGEKLMLIQLAEEGFVNRKNERVLRHLMRKGLIVRTPGLRLMNDSFHRFVLAVRGEEKVEHWEREGAEHGWAAWRGVLITVLLMRFLCASYALLMRFLCWSSS